MGCATSRLLEYSDGSDSPEVRGVWDETPKRGVVRACTGGVPEPPLPSMAPPGGPRGRGVETCGMGESSEDRMMGVSGLAPSETGAGADGSNEEGGDMSIGEDPPEATVLRFAKCGPTWTRMVWMQP
jgi:hypothetical protein